MALERSVIPLLKKRGSFILQQWMAAEKESAYHTTPFLKYLNDGHSSHPNLNHINRSGTQAFFSYFFPPFSASGTPRSLPPSTAENPFYHTTIMNHLLLPRDLECDQAYIYLIVSYTTMTVLCYIQSIYAVHRSQAVASSIRGHWAAYIAWIIFNLSLVSINYKQSFQSLPSPMHIS